MAKNCIFLLFNFADLVEVWSFNSSVNEKFNIKCLLKFMNVSVKFNKSFRAKLKCRWVQKSAWSQTPALVDLVYHLIKTCSFAWSCPPWNPPFLKFMTTLKGTRLDSPKKMQNKDEKSGDDKSLTDRSSPLSAFCSKNTTYLAKLAILLQYSPHKMLALTQVRNKCGVYCCCCYDKCKHPIWNTSFHFKAFHLMFL